MKKISWPFFETMEASGDEARDIEMFSNVYDSLIPEKSVDEDQETVYGYEGGIFSPVVDDDDGDVYLISESSAHSKNIKNLNKGSSVLDIEVDHSNSEDLSKLGLNVVSICQDKKRIAQTTDYQLISGDARYYNFSRKFDGFRCLKPIKNNEDYEVLIKNVYSQLRPVSTGVLRTAKDNKNILNILRKNNFNINKVSYFKDKGSVLCDIFVEKNDPDKVANIEIYSMGNNVVCPVTGSDVSYNYITGKFLGDNIRFSSEDSLIEFNKSPEDYIEHIAKFSCDIAKTSGEKIAGLQAYASLGSSAGLIFEYSTPQDVLYHMGTVAYPIDILFIDKNMRIKKICHNISPGSLATFGCHNIKYVLEVCGGLSEELGVEDGNFINIQKGFSKTIDSISKFSQLYNFGNKNIIANLNKKSYRFQDCNIVTFEKSSNPLVKNASIEKITDIQKSISNIKKEVENINIFDLDHFLFSNNSKIRLYKARAAEKDDTNIHRGFNNSSFVIEKDKLGSNVYLDIQLKDLISDQRLLKKISDYCIISGHSKSFKNFADIDNDIIKKIYNLSKDKNNKIVFSTRASGDIELLKNIICNRISLDRQGIALNNIDIVKIPNYFNKSNIINAISCKYKNNNVQYNNSISKAAGVAIPNDVKEKAKEAEKLLDESSRLCKRLIESFSKNLSEYEKIQAKPDVVKKSKGEYRLSSKRLLGKIRSMLVGIRDSIRILNEIRDVSTTYEVIDSLVGACAPVSDSAQEVFNLIDKIDTAEFFALLQSSTENFGQSAEDLESSIGRARDYINNNILGIVLISQ